MDSAGGRPVDPRFLPRFPLPTHQGVRYAIRNIVVEARKVEASGRTVRYLNIGDPIIFGFRTPPHMIEAVERAMRDGDNGYAPSAGILTAREAVATECHSARNGDVPDRVVDDVRHIRRDRTGADRSGGTGRRGADSGSHLSALYSRAREDRRSRGVLSDGSGARMATRFDHVRSLITPATRALVVIDPNNPTGPPTRRRHAALLSISPMNITFRCSPTKSTRTSPLMARSAPSPR